MVSEIGEQTFMISASASAVIYTHSPFEYKLQVFPNRRNVIGSCLGYWRTMFRGFLVGSTLFWTTSR
jgi:tetrahydromethanopterin S-methyltransferase subunit B